jgi:hypothetical protein
MVLENIFPQPRIMTFRRKPDGRLIRRCDPIGPPDEEMCLESVLARIDAVGEHAFPTMLDRILVIRWEQES